MDERLLTHDGESPFASIGLPITIPVTSSGTPPCLLSPSSEFHQNPFFTSFVTDNRHPYAFELGDLKDVELRKSLISRRDPSLFEDEDEEDATSIVGTPSTRNSSHPRFGSYSTASTISSATPSEADSDLIDRNKEDAADLSSLNGFLEIDGTKNDSQMHTLELGLCIEHPLLEVDALKRIRSDQTLQVDFNHTSAAHTTMDFNLRQLPQHAYHSEQGMTAFNTFDLSDFISDHDQESMRDESMAAMAAQHCFTTPDRHTSRDSLRVHSAAASPLGLSMSIASPVNANNGKTLNIQRSLSFNGAAAKSEERPNMAMRHSFNSAEGLSCNPAYINPIHDPSQFSNEDVFASSPLPGSESNMPPPPPAFYNGEHAPMTPQYVGASSQQIQAFWDDGGQDLHSGSSIHSSPLSCYSPAMVNVSLAEPMLSATGALRSARSSVAPISRTSSPYSSPLINSSSSYATLNGQPINGIITKRSRGRRVPNNPEELNNLGKGGKVYTCKVPGCGKCFKRSEHLKRHVRSIHTDEKPFMCHCGKSFSRHDNLNQHARVHTQQGANAAHSRSPLSFAANSQLAASPLLSDDLVGTDEQMTLHMAAANGDGSVQSQALYSIVQ